MPPLTSQDLQRFIESHQVEAAIVRCPEPTPTVRDAARIMGVRPEQIVKSLLFLVAGQPVLVIACGTLTVDRRPLADRFGVGKKQVKLADPETVLEVTGYPAGSVPPFGHRTPMTTIIDPHVLAAPFVYGGGGEEDTLVGLNPNEIQRITQAETLALLQMEQ